jgi:hypothetical protein
MNALIPLLQVSYQDTGSSIWMAIIFIAATTLTIAAITFIVKLYKGLFSLYDDVKEIRKMICEIKNKIESKEIK